jgi:uncharacterized protein YggE
VAPDLVTFEIQKIESLHETPSEAVRIVTATVSAFRERLISIDGISVALKPLTAQVFTIKSSIGIAASYSVSQSVIVTLHDFSLIRKLLEAAIAAGMNSIPEPKFNLSVSSREQAKIKAEGLARAELNIEVENFGKTVGLRLQSCGSEQMCGFR